MSNLVFKNFWTLFFDRSISADIKFFSILLLLIPIALITGPAIPDILLSLIALYFLIKSLIKKYWKYYKNPIVCGFLIFSVYGISRSIFSDFPYESLTNEGSVFYFRYIFFSMGVWYLLDNNSYLSKCLLYVIIACLIVVSFDGLYQYFNGVNIIGIEKFSYNRLTGFFGDEPIIGRYISYVSIFAFALIYKNFQYSNKIMIYSIALLMLSFVITFLSGERSPLFNLCFFILLAFIYLPKGVKVKIISILFASLTIILILQLNPNAKSRIIDKTIEQISETKIPYMPYSTHHEEHYISALKMFIDQPIFGVGTNVFSIQCQNEKYKYKSRSCSSHPHNYYIQLLAEQGFLGFSFLISFFIFISFLLIKNFIHLIFFKNKAQSSYDNFLFMAILLIYWWPFIPHMSFYNNWNNVIIMLPLGFFMSYIYQKK